MPRVASERWATIQIGASHAKLVARLIALLARHRPGREQRLRPCRLPFGGGEERPRAFLVCREALQRRARRSDSGLGQAKVGLSLVRLEARELLSQGDAASLVDEHFAEPAHEIETHRGFALALDGPAAERFSCDGSSVDPNDPHLDGRPDPKPRDEQRGREQENDP